MIENSYIPYHGGNITPYIGLSRTDYIKVTKGNTLIVRGIKISEPDDRGLAIYDINKKYISGLRYENENCVSVNITQNGYIALTIMPNISLEISISQNSVNSMFETLIDNDTKHSNDIEHILEFSEKEIEEFKNGNLNASSVKELSLQMLVHDDSSNLYDKRTTKTGGYIKGGTDGSVVTHATLCYTDYIPIEYNKSYAFNGNVYPGYMALYDENKNYLEGISGSRFVSPYTVLNENAKYIRITITKASNIDNISTVFYLNDGVNTNKTVQGLPRYIVNENVKIPSVCIQKDKVSNPTYYEGKEFLTFNKVFCIGDSLTSGTFNFNEGGTNESFVDRKYSYPTLMTKIFGIETDNRGKGGRSTRTWYEESINEDWSGFDCAIINLGANDDKLTDTSDSKTYLQLIVDRLKSTNNGIKIFITTLLPAYYNAMGTIKDIVNTRAREVVDENDDCYLIDLTTYSACDRNTAYSQSHLTALGYRKEAEELVAYASYIMATNIDDFKWIQFINTTHSFS